MMLGGGSPLPLGGPPLPLRTTSPHGQRPGGHPETQWGAPAPNEGVLPQVGGAPPGRGPPFGAVTPIRVSPPVTSQRRTWRRPECGIRATSASSWRASSSASSRDPASRIPASSRICIPASRIHIPLSRIPPAASSTGTPPSWALGNGGLGVQGGFGGAGTWSDNFRGSHHGAPLG